MSQPQGVKASLIDAATSRALQHSIDKYDLKKVWRGLLYQDNIDTDIVYGKAINFKDGNYLGDVTISHPSAGTFEISIPGGFPHGITFVKISNNISFGHIVITHEDDKIIVRTYNFVVASGFVLGDNLKIVSLEIIVMTRGANMSVVSAETNTDGDKIIVSFDKDIATGMFGDQACWISGDKTVLYLTKGALDNQVELTLDSAYADTDVITLAYDSSLTTDGFPYIESEDFGLLDDFTGLAVTNNIID